MNPRVLGAAAILPLLAPLAHADPDQYVSTPSVTYGEREIEFKFGTAKRPGEDRASAASLGYGYGLTQWWMTELYVKYNREGGEKTKFDAWEWENKFALSEPGQYPVDLGFLLEIERPKDRDEGYEIVFGPLFQTEFGPWQLNFNPLFERNYRTAEDNPLRLNYQWQVKYRAHPLFEAGAQGFGELGKWNHWAPSNEQSHRMGPAVFGKVALGGGQAIKYDAGVLFDVHGEHRGTTLRTQVEYEF